MSDQLVGIPNLGPFMVRCLEEVGITTRKDLHALGAVEAYARLKFHFGTEITLNALWAMDAGLSGIDWRTLSADRKHILKQQLARQS